MLSRLARLSSQRGIRSFTSRPIPSRSFPRSGFLLGAATVTATYFAWHLSSQDNWIALDSENPLPKGVDTSMASTPKPTSKKLKKKEPESQPPKGETKVDSEFVPEHIEGEYTEKSKTKTSEGASLEPIEGAIEEAAEEAESAGGAFNPVTGEINWDCPCLGGMAHGPCGPEFREAFSCFVYSEDEPKGINCVEKFKGMQDCFRRHPEVYAEEIMDDDDEEEQSASLTTPQTPPESDLVAEASTSTVPPIPATPKTTMPSKTQ